MNYFSSLISLNISLKLILLLFNNYNVQVMHFKNILYILKYCSL